MTLAFTASYLESILSQPDYRPVPSPFAGVTLTAEQRAEAQEIENIVGFGKDVIELFDSLMEDFPTLPTMGIFVEVGIPMMLRYISKNKPHIVHTDVVIDSCRSRLARTYISRVTELHLQCLFTEYLPHLTVKTHALLDSVMGVDFIVEDDVKRYYVHVTSNSLSAQKMLVQKESRGGRKVGDSFVPYSRDFAGDLILRYNRNSEDEFTKNVNGFPLFKADAIEWRFNLAKISKATGEDLNKPYGKVNHFKQWAITYLNLNITSI